MANEFSLALYEKVACKNIIQRALDIALLFLLVSLLFYRLYSLNNHGFVWLLAFFCESWFTFNWFLLVSSKWNPVDFKTYPENLAQRFPELPLVDMFVTTADPVLEPPIITVNTILSLLAVDYPADKLACYLSDDGCSPLTFYSLVEASKFAKLWVPFCKKYKIQVRAPFRYFLDDPISFTSSANSEFRQDWKKMKAEYEHLSLKIEEAGRKSGPWDLTGEFAIFSNVERSNHPTIIKAIGDNKQSSSDGDVPHLVYISREKRPKHAHHYKAGAMNVLTRVSGLMTNAPYMLNVDCDMFVNNPQVVRQAMCQLLDSKSEREIAFVQYPQCFYDGPKDDPYGNQLVVLMEYLGRGIAGIQGPCYSGTGCFHRRKVIYGLWPDDSENQGRNHTSIDGKLTDNEPLKEFGKSKEFSESVTYALIGKKGFSNNISGSLEAAFQVSRCGYEFGTSWGTKVGWIYGSMTEDVITGLTIHKKGWKSTFPMPNPPAFLGCAPSGGPAAMTQQKRWATGLLEILVSDKSPIFATLTDRLQFRMFLAYFWILSWGLGSIPELCYAALPAYCIIANSHFLPKVQDPAILIPLAIFVIYNLLTLREYLKTGISIRAWWNNMRMGRINAASAYLFGTLSVVLKLLGLSDTVFEVTQKDQSSDGDQTNDTTNFTFDASPIFVPGTTLMLVHLTALLALSLKLRPLVHDVGHVVGLGEVLCSIWVVLCFLPFLKGLFRTGKYGIPSSTIFKSTSLALVFVYLCRTS
ncbi:PREDICTED: cellulose synthase-like protein B4 [Theobroma cacao]|uniref:Cellulose synthase-like protein B4 n=1 Tax=Theobroma cacao TaxID=3641 RepID=A0AB32VLC6_THECC|nr:PREDICTED: cellulose synthase-like protein B4 [Theobroma cacao]